MHTPTPATLAPAATAKNASHIWDERLGRETVSMETPLKGASVEDKRAVEENLAVGGLRCAATSVAKLRTRY